MKLTVTQLRRLIKEVLEEQGWPPRRWYPSSGEPVTDDDLERMGHQGFLDGEYLEEEELDEA